LARVLEAEVEMAKAFGALGKTQQYAVILQLVTARSTTVRAARIRRAMTTLAGL
jgi:hypothetical protein